MTYDLSVFLGGIRTENWKRLYDSIESSVGDYTWELVICSPYELPDELKDKDNIKLIIDWGAPTRCYQIAGINCSGKYICYASDDGWFLGNELEKRLDKLENNPNEKYVIVTKYIEAGNDYPNWVYTLKMHDNLRYNTYPNHYVLFNVCLMHNKYFRALGGFDCQFEVCPLAFVDFGIRVQRDSQAVEMDYTNIFECTQNPGHEGDHGPIHDAQLNHDQPIMDKIYSQPEVVNRINIDIDNWTQEPERWTRRFALNEN